MSGTPSSSVPKDGDRRAVVVTPTRWGLAIDPLLNPHALRDQQIAAVFHGVEGFHRIEQ